MIATSSSSLPLGIWIVGGIKIGSGLFHISIPAGNTGSNRYAKGV